MLISFYKKIIALVILTLYQSDLLATISNDISTSNILEFTAQAVSYCLHYKIIGICSWLVCDGPDCHIETSPKVEHYLPDAVVSVYRKTESNPWNYARELIDPAAYQAGQAQIKSILGFNLGYGNQSESNANEQNNHFKEVDLIGNPAISLFSSHSNVFLPSQAKPFTPYYLSLGDAYAWRTPLIEATRYATYLVPGVHIVGSLINNWGAVYPRVGFIHQSADGKAAAVIAQRAADIATRGSQPHIYHPLNTNDSCGDHCQAWEVLENDAHTRWQMVYPMPENQCNSFGENDLLLCKQIKNLLLQPLQESKVI